MRIHLKRISPGEEDPELIWGVLFGTLCLLGLGVAVHLPESLAPTCLLRATLGWPCPACGSFRAAQFAWNGQFVAAWRIQPLLMGGMCLGVLGTLYSWGAVLLRTPRIRVTLTRRGESALLTSVCVAALLANWVYLCATL